MFYTNWRRGIPPPIKPVCSLAVSPKGSETKFKETITTTTTKTQNRSGIQGNKLGAVQPRKDVGGRGRKSYTTE